MDDAYGSIKEMLPRELRRMEQIEKLMQEGRLPARLVPVLRQFVEALQTRLAGVVRSVALYGSVSIGAFEEKSSDVDFVVAVERTLTAEELDAVGEMHLELVQRDPFAKRLDGFYIPAADLQEGKSATYPYFREGVYHGMSTFGSVYRWQAGNHAVVVYGDALQMKLPAWSEIEREMSYNVNHYWAGKVQQPELFVDDEWVPFAVLTFLRIEHTLRCREIISKKQAGQLALQRGAERWHRLIREALRIQYGDGQESLYETKEERAAETVFFIEEYTRVCNGLLP